MKKTYQILVLMILSIFLFASCGEDDIKEVKETHKITFKISYKGDSKVKQIRAAIFDNDLSVTNGVATGAPADALSHPVDGPLTDTDVDFTKEITIDLKSAKGKKYLVVIYGDVDPNDGRQAVNIIDPLYTLENFTSTEDKVIEIELKDQEATTNKTTFKISYTGNSEVKQVRAALFDNETSVVNGQPTGAPSSALSFPVEGPMTEGSIDFTQEVNIDLSSSSDKKYLVVIYGDVDPEDGVASPNIIDPIYIQQDFSVSKDGVLEIELEDQTCTPVCENKVCGDDSCGGTCGICEGDKVCSDDQTVCEENTCVPSCDSKICGDDGCGSTCGTCEGGTFCSTDQTICEEGTASHTMTFTVNYSGNKVVKKIALAGYNSDLYAGMPQSTFATDLNESGLTFPFTFTYNPLTDGSFKLTEDFDGTLYIHMYATDSRMPSDDLPQLKFPITLPGVSIHETVEILDL